MLLDLKPWAPCWRKDPGIHRRRAAPHDDLDATDTLPTYVATAQALLSIATPAWPATRDQYEGEQGQRATPSADAAAATTARA
eukprot:11719568-Alexandrium_andersonii.AAC.1